EWKVYANRDTGLGNCFHGSCQETFNTYKFTAKIAGDAGGSAFAYLQTLATELGYRARPKAVADIETYDATEWSLPKNIALPDSRGNMLPYLTERGVDAETARWFDLRYCHDSWYSYTKIDGSDGFAPFKRRVIFPVYDLDGTMVTFQGRDITGQDERKYTFPPRLPGTGRYLYNGHRAFGKRRLLLCEGSMDVIGAHAAVRDLPDTGVVGSFGMHLSTGDDGNDQLSRFLELKRRGLEEVIIMWDGEAKAYEKAVVATKALRGIGLTAKVATLPAGRDPGDAGVDVIRRTINGAREIRGTGALLMALKNPYR
ncbi:MAG: hypothetical protein KI788_17095, partial [Mameliella sp.]|nr:hypothetical protein [Mameliella sp.]